MPFAFESSRGNRGVEIFVADGEGADVRRVADGRNPDWSPDGRLAFDSSGGGRPSGVFVVYPDGSGLRYVGEGNDPSWSPDGRQIAVERGNAIYVLDVDGAALARLVVAAVPGHTMAREPAWSPDGTRLAFSVCSEWSSPWDYGLDCSAVHLVPVDGSQAPAPVSAHPGFKPAWSPDGSRLAFDYGGTIYVTEVDTRATKVAGQGSGPAWTPDGRLVFSRPWQGSSGARLIIADGIERLLVPEVATATWRYEDMNIAIRR